jgi:hypothetical protein
MLRASLKALPFGALLGLPLSQRVDWRCSRTAVKAQHWRSRLAVGLQLYCGCPAVAVQFSVVCLQDPFSGLRQFRKGCVWLALR